MSRTEGNIDDSAKVIYQGSISRKLRPRRVVQSRRRPISARDRLRSKTKTRAIRPRRRRPQSAVHTTKVGTAPVTIRRPLSALPNKLSQRQEYVRPAISPTDVSRQTISQLIESVNTIATSAIAWELKGNNVSTKNKNKSGRRRKRPPFAKSQRAVSSKTSKKKQQPWDDRTGIDRVIRNERVMNKPRRRPKQKKLPMSEKNIVQFMKHILQYRRTEARALQACNKAKYAIKMIVRRCSAESAANRENNSGPWGGGTKLLDKLEDVIAQGMLCGLSADSDLYISATALLQRLKRENAKWEQLQALRRKRAARIIQEKLFFPRLDLLYRSAVNIQRVVRGFLPKKYLNHLKRTTKRGFALLQAQYRGIKAREKFRVMREAKLVALLRIQCWSRVHLAKKLLRLKKQQYKSSIAVNAVIRGYLARKHVASLRQQYYGAATIIQCAVRSYRSRKLLEIKRQYKSINATTIQCMFRCNKAKRVTQLLRRVHTAVSELKQHSEHASTALARLKGDAVDNEIITGWDEACEALKEVMKQVEDRKKEAKTGGVDAKHLQSSQIISTEKRAIKLLKEHSEREKLRIMCLSSIKAEARAFKLALAARDENYTQSVTMEKTNERLSDGIARLEGRCQKGIRSSPELSANKHYMIATKLLVDGKQRIARCKLLGQIAQYLNRAISTAKTDREWKPLLGLVECFAHKFPELRTEAKVLPKLSAKLPAKLPDAQQATPKFHLIYREIVGWNSDLVLPQWKDVNPDLVEEKLREDVRKACGEAHKLSQTICLDERLQEATANAREQRYEWGITQLETCLQDTLAECPDLVSSAQVRIAQALLQELKDEEKERKMGMESDLEKLAQVCEECQNPPNDDKLRMTLKEVLDKHPDADDSKQVCDAKVLVEILARKVLQVALDQAKKDKLPKPLDRAMKKFKQNAAQDVLIGKKSALLMEEAESCLRKLRSLHKKLASAKRQLTDCLNGCYNSRVSGALHKCITRLENEFPVIKRGGVLSAHPAGKEMENCKENLKIFLREEQEFDERLTKVMNADWKVLKSTLETALLERPEYKNREIVQLANDTLKRSLIKSPIHRADSFQFAATDSDYDSGFDDDFDNSFED